MGLYGSKTPKPSYLMGVGLKPQRDTVYTACSHVFERIQAMATGCSQQDDERETGPVQHQSGKEEDPCQWHSGSVQHQVFMNHTTKLNRFMRPASPIKDWSA